VKLAVSMTLTIVSDRADGSGHRQFCDEFTEIQELHEQCCIAIISTSLDALAHSGDRD
jgi:hypothetical protein